MPTKFYNDDVIRQLSTTDIGSATKLGKVAADESVDERISEIADLVRSIIFIHMSQESVVDDLGKRLLRLVGIGRIDGVSILGPRELSYTRNNRREIHAKPEVVVEIMGGTIIVVVQEDKSTKSNEIQDVEAQLVAQMVVAYINNLSFIDSKNQTMYGVTLLGTQPTFYKMQLTADIAFSIIEGKSSSTTLTTLYRYALDIRKPTFIMDGPENVLHMMSCYQALRNIVEESIVRFKPQLA